jgi:hypothetical protein
MGNFQAEANYIKPPDPNSTMQQIQGFIRLRDLANAEAARNSIAQQQFDATAPLRQAQAQWYQQRVKDNQSALDQQAQMNSLIKQYAQGGKFDADGFMDAANQAGLGAIAPDYGANLQKVEQNKDAILKARLDNAKAAGQGRASAVSVASKFSQTPVGALMAYHTLVESGSPDLAQQFQARVNDPDQGGVQGGFGYLSQLNNAYQSAAKAAQPNKPERGTFADPTTGQAFPGTIQSNGAGVMNDITGQVVPNARLYEKQSVPSPREGMVNGQRVFGILRDGGWVSTSGQPLPGFAPVQPERSGSGSQKFSPQNPAPQSAFQAADDQKAAELAQAEAAYTQQRQKIEDAMGSPSAMAALTKKLAATKQEIENKYEAQVRKLGGQPQHYSYFQPQPQAATQEGQPTGKPLTADIARQLLVQAGGNKDLARTLATKAGYSF